MSCRVVSSFLTQASLGGPGKEGFSDLRYNSSFSDAEHDFSDVLCQHGCTRHTLAPPRYRAPRPLSNIPMFCKYYCLSRLQLLRRRYAQQPPDSVVLLVWDGRVLAATNGTYSMGKTCSIATLPYYDDGGWKSFTISPHNPIPQFISSARHARQSLVYM